MILVKSLQTIHKSFTVPATPNNNKIFAHWYENSIDDGFNANKRYDAGNRN